MRKLFLFAVVLLVATSVTAQPFFQCDVVPGVASCGIFMDAAPKVVVPAIANTCKFDLATIAVGPHSAKCSAISVSDPVWGTQESAQSSPLAFTKPTLAPAVPTNLRLVP